MKEKAGCRRKLPTKAGDAWLGVVGEIGMFRCLEVFAR